ncbi:MAG: hypothetical protein IJB85_06565 [Clostridia bacterium]|nr:hypothetical protein [Clostridia bacterium]
MAENRKKWLKNHWAYSWWKYMAMAIISVMGVNLLFTTTAYRAPEHKKIEVYVLNSYVDAAALDSDFRPLFFEAHPDQEELAIMNVNLSADDMYVRMQYTTYVAAQQGDVMLLPKAEIEKLAESGADNAFLELSPYIESGLINLSGIGGETLLLPDSSGVQGVYGVAADSLFGLLDFGNDPADSYLCIMNYSGNEDTAASVLNMMLHRYHGEEPDWYEARKQEMSNQGVLF